MMTGHSFFSHLGTMSMTFPGVVYTVLDRELMKSTPKKPKSDFLSVGDVINLIRIEAKIHLKNVELALLTK